MDEQEATDKLEELVGSIDGCFRLMRLYRDCDTSVRTQVFGKPRKVEDVFRDRAKAERYTPEAINHYLNHVR